MKMRVAADTSALLSLALSGLLKKSLHYFSFFTGPIIKTELERTARIKDVLGNAAATILDLIECGEITIVETGVRGTGEEEALEIAKTAKCEFLISDDIKFVEKLSHKTENIHFSIFIIFSLYGAGEISKQEAQNAIDNIFQKRQWTDNLIGLFAREFLQ